VSFNWVDVLLIVLIIITVILGMIKGLMRQVIGILAVFLGLILAIVYSPHVAKLIMELGADKSIAYVLAFFLILGIVMMIGWLSSRMFLKIKGPVKFFDRLLGGGLGFVKGVIICGAVVYTLYIFLDDKDTMKNSVFAPYTLRITNAVVSLIPRELKDRFSKAYKDIVHRRGDEKDGV
jgi:membrane protein required for colicin V production